MNTQESYNMFNNPAMQKYLMLQQAAQQSQHQQPVPLSQQDEIKQAAQPHPVNMPPQLNSPLSSGAQAGIESSKRSLKMTEDENQRALHMAFMHFFHNNNPNQYRGMGSGLAKLNDSFLPAMKAYEAERGRVANENYTLMQHQENLRKHQADEEYQRMHLMNQMAEHERPYNEMTQYQKSIIGEGGGGGGGTSVRRYAPTNLGKLYNERARAIELEGEDSPIVQQYDLAIQKATTDSDVRRRNLFANNLVKSMENANVDDLVQFSGPSGQINLKYEQTKDMLGKPSEQYMRYKEAKQAVSLEAKEVRQFFGDSITKEVQQALKDMVDATSLTVSPKTAKRMINKSREIIKKQLGTYQKALTSTSPYARQEKSFPIEEESGTVNPQIYPNGITEEDIDFTAREEGLTREEVLEKLGIRNAS
jgi:hypothetical protein